MNERLVEKQVLEKLEKGHTIHRGHLEMAQPYCWDGDHINGSLTDAEVRAFKALMNTGQIKLKRNG